MKEYPLKLIFAVWFHWISHMTNYRNILVKHFNIKTNDTHLLLSDRGIVSSRHKRTKPMKNFACMATAVNIQPCTWISLKVILFYKYMVCIMQVCWYQLQLHNATFVAVKMSMVMSIWYGHFCSLHYSGKFPWHAISVSMVALSYTKGALRFRVLN